MLSNYPENINSGADLVKAIEERAKELISKNQRPEIIVVGNFFYYLLKQYHNAFIDTKRNKYFEIYTFPIFGFNLEIHVKRETMKEGPVRKDGSFLKVYAE